ncbi:xanthine dehydrogenase family protein subunit M [Synergistaceae bacterium OttesenSCG-928-I11]|nr:xanthine dehydrogenase family protein subunit M [Synergistaceae bacterium OttesenSCG-928-I11]
MNNITYHAPKTIAEAVSLLSEVQEARILAGGTDLIAKWKKSHFFDMNLVDIRNIGELSVIEEREGRLFIGAGVTMDRVCENPAINEKFPILAEAASKVGSVQIRNLATIGGNSCNAAPSADTVLPLIAYGADVCIVSKSGERRCALKDFFKGPGKTALEKGEMLKGFSLPYPAHGTVGMFVKHSRRPGMDLATVGVATVVRLDAGKIAGIHVVLGAVGPVPIDVEGLDVFVGKEMGAASEKIAGVCTDAAKPITDVRGSKEYRSEMVRRSVALCLEGSSK